MSDKRESDGSDSDDEDDNNVPLMQRYAANPAAAANSNNSNSNSKAGSNAQSASSSASAPQAAVPQSALSTANDDEMVRITAFLLPNRFVARVKSVQSSGCQLLCNRA